ncbi:MAG: hypothetical protein V1779_05620 [bacterium]
MKKNYIYILLFVFVSCLNNLYSQPVQYASLEIVNGSPTGYTNVITLLWINSDTVQVTKSQRISTGGDTAITYNLASLDYTQYENEVIFTLEDDVWIIPFDQGSNPSLCQSGNLYFGCECKAAPAPPTGSCGIWTYDDGTKSRCFQNTCSGFCQPYYRDACTSGGTTAIILKAKEVIYD